LGNEIDADRRDAAGCDGAGCGFGVIGATDRSTDIGGSNAFATAWGSSEWLVITRAMRCERLGPGDAGLAANSSRYRRDRRPGSP
jgi:hypothetical protein